MDHGMLNKFKNHTNWMCVGVIMFKNFAFYQSYKITCVCVNGWWCFYLSIIVLCMFVIIENEMFIKLKA
jgi:hypothetical protein